MFNVLQMRAEVYCEKTFCDKHEIQIEDKIYLINSASNWILICYYKRYGWPGLSFITVYAIVTDGSGIHAYGLLDFCSLVINECAHDLKVSFLVISQHRHKCVKYKRKNSMMSAANIFLVLEWIALPCARTSKPAIFNRKLPPQKGDEVG